MRVAPGGRFIVDTYSRVDMPPVTVLRASDGRVVRTLEKSDASALMATGYRPPEPFKVKARDGLTDLYGAIWKPSDFDSTKIYPVIDNIYPGPQLTTGPKGFVPNNNPNVLDAGYSQYSQAKALAELGFIVVNIDAMGTTHRSKAFREYWYANMGDNGLLDHIVGIKQLAATRPYMDLTRVGIYGISGGGFASTDAILRYPEFYKVAISSSGNHDNRSYNMHWGEKYTGVRVTDTLRKTDNFESQANLNLVPNLTGKLFLIHGDMDDNVNPTNTLRLVDALVKAGKTFDMLILPDKGHMMYYLPYVHRVIGTTSCGICGMKSHPRTSSSTDRRRRDATDSRLVRWHCVTEQPLYRWEKAQRSTLERLTTADRGGESQRTGSLRISGRKHTALRASQMRAGLRGGPGGLSARPTRRRAWGTHDDEPVPLRDRREFRDVRRWTVVVGRQHPRGRRLSHGPHEALELHWREPDKSAGCGRGTIEGVRHAFGAEGEAAGRQVELRVADPEGEGAVEDVEPLVLLGVHVPRRAEPLGHDDLEHAESPIGVRLADLDRLEHAEEPERLSFVTGQGVPSLTPSFHDRRHETLRVTGE